MEKIYTVTKKKGTYFSPYAVDRDSLSIQTRLPSPSSRDVPPHYSLGTQKKSN